MIEEYSSTTYSMFCDKCGRELIYTSDEIDDIEDFARDEDWLVEKGDDGRNHHFCCHKCYLDYLEQAR